MLGRFEVIWKPNVKGQLRRSTTSHLRGLMFFYVIMCVSWSYEVHIWVKMIFIGSVLSFMTFGGQTSKTFEGLPLTRSCLCWVCHACFEFFTCSLWVKLEWKVQNLLWCIFTLENPGYNFLWVPQKGPHEGPRGYWHTTLAKWTQRHPICWHTDHFWGSIRW